MRHSLEYNNNLNLLHLLWLITLNYIFHCSASTESLSLSLYIYIYAAHRKKIKALHHSLHLSARRQQEHFALRGLLICQENGKSAIKVQLRWHDFSHVQRIMITRGIVERVFVLNYFNSRGRYWVFAGIANVIVATSWRWKGSWVSLGDWISCYVI
jgi:hypothetical protein